MLSQPWCGGVGRARQHSLRWFSRGASVGGAKVKLCIWAVWGSNGRPPASPGMLEMWMCAVSGELGVGGVDTAAGSSVAPGRAGSQPITRVFQTALWPAARQDAGQKAGRRLREGVDVGLQCGAVLLRARNLRNAG